MIEKCWSKDPNERPTFKQLFNKLAFNVEESIYDIFDSNDLNYYLDDVDVYQLFDYIDSISENEEINEIKTSHENEKMHHEIDELRREIHEINKKEDNSEEFPKNDEFSFDVKPDWSSPISHEVQNSKEEADSANKKTNLFDDDFPILHREEDYSMIMMMIALSQIHHQ